jgi:CubicO group peptidase (beta-lactamase class C family)
MRQLFERTELAVLALAVGALGCSNADADADPDPDHLSSVPVTGDCEQDTADALAAWGSAGFNGAVVIDSPDDSPDDAAEGGDGDCRLGVGTLAPDGDQPVTTDSVFAIGSVSKAFTAAAVLQLVEKEAVDLEAPAGRYVEGLGGPAASASIESLLLHTSGLVGSHGEDHSPLDRDQAVAAISALTVDDEAQGQFLYSNAGYTLLALVAESASGTDYRSYLADNVLPDGTGFWDGSPAPAGDEQVTGVVDGEPASDQGDFAGPHWAVQGNGDVAMSADQLAGWTHDLFTGEGGIVPADQLALVTEPAIEDDDTGQGITMGWVRLDAEAFGEPVLAAAGGGGDTGQNVVTAWLPESERTVVVASSTDGVTAEALLQTIGPAIAAGDPLPRPDAPADAGEVDPATLDEAAGTYVLPAESDAGDATFEVTAEDGHLVVAPTGPAAFAALGLAGDTPADEVADHEQAVEDMLAGGTAPGAEEVGLLEDDFGELQQVEILGSMVGDGELRTYVRLTFDGDSSEAGWYALDSSGGIAGVDLSGPPSVELQPTTGEEFQVRAAAGAAGEQAVTVSFDDGTMTIDGPGGPSTAERAKGQG